ncbi:hypothetical protein [Coralloluteibacterium thermophilus]|uniref:Uncharacterized protein n=1 Tax=Coralloluteibacterium thermophilum TaxID=2707049 RepID=A0ABV9NSF4_9GAMM
MSIDPAWQQRRAFEEKLDQLERENAIGAGDREALVARFDAMQRELADELALVVKPEYERRCREDGDEAARAWLAEAGRDLGQRAGTQTRAMILEMMERARDAA